MSANRISDYEKGASTPRTGPLPGARAALLLLLSINLFNYIDRQVLAAVVPEIRKEFFSGGTLPGAEGSGGFLAGIFSRLQHLFGSNPENTLIGFLAMA